MQTVRPALIGALTLAVMAALPLAAAPRPILDYRKATIARPPVLSPQTRAALAKAMGEPAGKAWAVLGQARGSFSAANTVEELYLVADRAPVAAEPFPEGPGQLLVAIGTERASVYKLPADLRYQRIAGTVDADGDGRGEVLLESTSYNMGQSITSVDLVGLGADGAATVRQSLKEVASDSCDNRGGRREKQAGTISLDGGKLVAQVHKQRCG